MVRRLHTRSTKRRVKRRAATDHSIASFCAAHEGGFFSGAIAAGFADPRPNHLPHKEQQKMPYGILLV